MASSETSTISAPDGSRYRKKLKHRAIDVYENFKEDLTITYYRIRREKEAVEQCKKAKAVSQEFRDERRIMKWRMSHGMPPVDSAPQPANEREPGTDSEPSEQCGCSKFLMTAGPSNQGSFKNSTPAEDAANMAQTSKSN